MTPDQKLLWDARKAEIKAEQAARIVTAESRRGREPDQIAGSDRERIRALDEEVKILKEEIAKLKAAVAAAPPKLYTPRGNE